MAEVFLTHNAEETQTFAQGFAKKLHGGDIVLLYGNLGAGKTTFVQGLARGLGITHRIISPTFIILRTYKVKSENQESKIKNFYHVDLYRLESEKEIEDIGLLDLMRKQENIVVIEWPEKLGQLLPENAWQLHFENKGEDIREIRVEK